MELKLLCFGLVMALIGAAGVGAQSYSFGIGFDSADAFQGTPFFESSRQTTSSASSRSSSSSSRATPSAPSRTSTTSSRRPSSRASAGEPTGSVSSFSFSGLDDETLRIQPRQRPTPVVTTTQRAPSVRIQQQPARPRSQSSRSRPSVSQNEVESGAVTIGQSPCARGAVGKTCREHLRNTAMACTSGKCHKCQSCGSVGANEWVECCRDHFLCCRPLARACQRCDQPQLLPFCNAAFGKCQ